MNDADPFDSLTCDELGIIVSCDCPLELHVHASIEDLHIGEEVEGQTQLHKTIDIAIHRFERSHQGVPSRLGFYVKSKVNGDILVSFQDLKAVIYELSSLGLDAVGACVQILLDKASES